MKLDRQQLINLLEGVDISKKAYRWRLGQTVWNIGAIMFPAAFESFRGSIWDPFFQDKKIITLFPLIFDEEALEYWETTDLFKKLNIPTDA